jgi:hypothetical protein
MRELFCRSGLKYYARITTRNIHAAQVEVERQRALLATARPTSACGKILKLELDLAARMAAESCRIMRWQQTLAGGHTRKAKALAKAGNSALREITQDFDAYWPLRNKATPAKCSAFLRWRRQDYRRGKLAFPPEVARLRKAKAYAAE